LPFGLNLKGEEISAAEELPCLLHGNRIAGFSRVVYRSEWMADDETQPWWEATNPQYKKAVLATRAFLEAGK
jgi:hypothetical protein